MLCGVRNNEQTVRVEMHVNVTWQRILRPKADLRKHHPAPTFLPSTTLFALAGTMRKEMGKTETGSDAAARPYEAHRSASLALRVVVHASTITVNCHFFPAVTRKRRYLRPVC